MVCHDYDDQEVMIMMIMLERVFGAMVAMVGRAAQGITSSCHCQTTNSLLLLIILKIMPIMILKIMLKIILKIIYISLPNHQQSTAPNNPQDNPHNDTQDNA